MDMQKHFLYKTELERILFMREIIIFYIYCIPTMMSEYWANPKIKNRFLQFTVTQLENGWRELVFISIGIFKLTLYNFLVCIYKYNFVNRRKYNRTNLNIYDLHTGCPKKHGNSVTNSISSLLWISIVIPNFKSHVC